MLANTVNKQDHTEGRNTCCSPNSLNNGSFHITQSVDGSYDYFSSACWICIPVKPKILGLSGVLKLWLSLRMVDSGFILSSYLSNTNFFFLLLENKILFYKKR